MASSKNRNISKQVQILQEYSFVYEIAKGLNKICKTLVQPANIATLHRELVQYEKTLNYSRSQDEDFFEKENFRYSECCKLAVEEALRCILSLSPKIVKIVNYNHKGRSNGSTDKTDVRVTIDGKDNDWSLKIYKNAGNIQVASGTYTSTIFSLASTPIGVGRYEMPNGEEINTMSGDYETAFRTFAEAYGSKAGDLIEKLKRLDKEFKPLTKEHYIGDGRWGTVCKNVAFKAIPLMIELINIIDVKSGSAQFTKRLLDRLGLSGGHDIILVQGKKTFTSLNNKKTKEILKRLPHSKVTVRQSGKKADGQGLLLEFRDSGGCILSCNMPLTINKNGAWQLSSKPDRFCKLDNAVIPYGDPRPKKSKQIATSTNCYLNPQQIFFGV